MMRFRRDLIPVLAIPLVLVGVLVAYFGLLVATMCITSGAIGYLIGKHTNVEFDVSEEIEQPKGSDILVLRRKPVFLAAFISTLVMLAVTVQSSVSWYRAAEARDRAAEAAQNAKSALVEVKDVQDCIERNFSAFSTVTAERIRLAGEDRVLDRREAGLAVATRDATTAFLQKLANTPPEDIAQRRSALLTFLQKLARIDVSQTEIKTARAGLEKERTSNPVDPYPEGKCDK